MIFFLSISLLEIKSISYFFTNNLSHFLDTKEIEKLHLFHRKFIGHKLRNFISPQIKILHLSFAYYSVLDK